jgi:nitrate reductase delta subunit
MGTCGILAEALRYPAPGQAEVLQRSLALIAAGAVRQSFEAFVRAVHDYSLGEWEEVYTHTLDLNPSLALYIGFQTWGESYQRGQFMADLNREMQVYSIDMEGELPDHLIPVLRYLDVAEQPLPELCETLSPALRRVLGVLRQVDARNPYLHLLEAIDLATQPLAATPKEAPEQGDLQPVWKTG